MDYTNFFKNMKPANTVNFCLSFLFLTIINLLIVSLVRQENYYLVINQTVFGFKINLWVIALMTMVISLFLVKTDFWQNYPISSSLILSGVWSNLLERLWFGGVADYLNLYIAIGNITDLQIWIGLLMLNIQLFWPTTTSKFNLTALVNQKSHEK